VCTTDHARLKLVRVSQGERDTVSDGIIVAVLHVSLPEGSATVGEEEPRDHLPRCVYDEVGSDVSETLRGISECSLMSVPVNRRGGGPARRVCITKWEAHESHPRRFEGLRRGTMSAAQGTNA
jgi:hypothetical protein